MTVTVTTVTRTVGLASLTAASAVSRHGRGVQRRLFACRGGLGSRALAGRAGRSRAPAGPPGRRRSTIRVPAGAPWWHTFSSSPPPALRVRVRGHRDDRPWSNGVSRDSEAVAATRITVSPGAASGSGSRVSRVPVPTSQSAAAASPSRPQATRQRQSPESGDKAGAGGVSRVAAVMMLRRGLQHRCGPDPSGASPIPPWRPRASRQCRGAAEPRCEEGPARARGPRPRVAPSVDCAGAARPRPPAREPARSRL